MENSENKVTNKMVNKVELNGFAGINPEVVKIKDGLKVARFNLATSESYKNRNGETIKDTTWHRIVLWNKLADQAQTLVKKGSRINLLGKLVNSSYTDQKGEKHYTTEIIAYSFEIVKQEELQNQA